MFDAEHFGDTCLHTVRLIVRSRGYCRAPPEAAESVIAGPALSPTRCHQRSNSSPSKSWRRAPTDAPPAARPAAKSAGVSAAMVCRISSIKPASCSCSPILHHQVDAASMAWRIMPVVFASAPTSRPHSSSFLRADIGNAPARDVDGKPPNASGIETLCSTERTPRLCRSTNFSGAMRSAVDDKPPPQRVQPVSWPCPTATNSSRC